MAATAKIFDAAVQKEVDYVLTLDPNGEVVATSSETGNTLKFPAGLSKAELDKLIAEHNEANEGQEVISAEEQKQREENLQKSQDLLREFGATDNDLQVADSPADEAPEE
jgi:thioredoxin reductase